MSSSSAIEPGPFASYDSIECSATTTRALSTEPVTWGHYDDSLSTESLEFAERFAPRLAELNLNESFNRLSNALRLYQSALTLTPSDVALVVFMSVLEGLFTSATQELSYRLALTVSWFLEDTKEARLQVFLEDGNSTLFDHKLFTEAM